MDSIYRDLAPFYDVLNRDIDYERWADYIHESIDRYAVTPVHDVLDLGCGTGSMTLALAARGYDMVGVDLSPEMLSIARNRADTARCQDKVLWLCQDMCSFELYGTVEAAVCCLDGLNHLTGQGQLSRCLRLVHNYVSPDGLFLFDVNSPYKFRNIYGTQAYILEDKHVFCAWQNAFCEEKGLCDFYISLFTETPTHQYRRSDSHTAERMYTREELISQLQRHHFEILEISGDIDHRPDRENDERLYFITRVKKD